MSYLVKLYVEVRDASEQVRMERSLICPFYDATDSEPIPEGMCSLEDIEAFLEKK